MLVVIRFACHVHRARDPRETRIYATVPCHTSPTGKRVRDPNNANALNYLMSTQRKTTRHELSSVERAYLVGRHDAGESFGQISHETGIPKTTIVDTIHNATERGNTNSLPRPHPRKTDARTDRRLCRDTRRDPSTRRIPLAKLQVNFQPSISRRTIQRRLHNNNIQKWLAKGRIGLTMKHKKA